MTRSERIYRALLLAYPERTRLILGEDMAQLFRDRMRDAGSPLEQANVWFEVIADIAVTAPQEHIARRRARQVVEGSAPEPTRPMRPDLAVAAVPLLLAVLLPLVLPGYYRPLFDDRVSILGLPAGEALLISGALLAALGVFGARRGGLREPRAQAWVLVILLGLLLPIILLGVFALPPVGWAGYVVAVTLFVLLLRYRIVMLAFVLPFAAVLLFGPSLVLVMVSLRV
jgi:hypothetical protein